MGRLRGRLARSSPLLGSAALGAIVFLVAALRDHGAEWQARSVWGNLEPLVDVVTAQGARLTRETLGGLPHVVHLLTGLFAVLGLVGLWRRSYALFSAALGGIVLSWSWLSLFDGELGQGVWMLGLAAACLFAGGLLTRGRFSAPPPPNWRLDVPLVVLLVAGASLARLFALTELPNYFIGEMSVSMLAPVTWNGLWTYIPEAMQTVSIGCAHLFVQWVAYSVFGSSVFAIRVTAVAFGVAVVWVLYWLVRKIAGRQAGVVTASLAALAPEQLWWSRNENAYFIAVCFAGAMTAWLSWEVRRHPSAGRILWVCLWMACSRLFYLAAVALVVVPPALLLHGVLFEAGQRRRMLVAFLVVSTVGLSGWAMSPTLVSFLGSGEWRFVHPARHGELAAPVEPPGRFAQLEYQGKKVARNALEVGRALVVHRGFDHWYQRVDRLDRSTWINLAVAGLAAAGFLLALGQLTRADAALLWLWLAAGLAPALLSEAPDSRRMASAYPAFYAAAGWLWGWLHSTLRAQGGSWAARTVSIFAWPCLVAIALSSAASHFLLPRHEIPLVRTARLVSKDFSYSGAIYYDMDQAAFPLYAAVHADRWVDRKPCLQDVRADWLGSALRQDCRYDDISLRVIYSTDVMSRGNGRDSQPHAVTFLVGEVPRRSEKLERLRQLFPDAEREEMLTQDASYSLAIVRVREADLRRLRQVQVVSRQDRTGRVWRPRIAEPRVSVKSERVEAGQSMRVVASLLVDREGWYRFEPVAGCGAVSFQLAGRWVSPGWAGIPLTVGFWPLTVHLGPDCNVPVALRWQGLADAVPPLALFDPHLADADLLRPAPMRLVRGYRFAGRFGEVRGSVIDMRHTADGLVVLSAEGSDLELQWFDRFGAKIRQQTLDALRGRSVFAMAASTEGQVLLLTGEGPMVLDRDGTLRAHWGNVELPTADLVWLSPDRLVAALPAAGGLVEFDASGRELAVYRELGGAAAPFFNPVSVARSEDGKTWAVAQLDGHVVVFRTSGGLETARFVREIPLPLLTPGVWPRSLTFQGTDRLFVAEPERVRLLVYSVDGERLLAQQPEHDWSTLLGEIGEVRRIVPFGDSVVVLGSVPWLARFDPIEP